MMMMFGALFVDNESIIHCNGALLILDQLPINWPIPPILFRWNTLQNEVIYLSIPSYICINQYRKMFSFQWQWFISSSTALLPLPE